MYLQTVLWRLINWHYWSTLRWNSWCKFKILLLILDDWLTVLAHSSQHMGIVLVYGKETQTWAVFEICRLGLWGCGFKNLVVSVGMWHSQVWCVWLRRNMWFQSYMYIPGMLCWGCRKATLVHNFLAPSGFHTNTLKWDALLHRDQNIGVTKKCRALIHFSLYMWLDITEKSFPCMKKDRRSDVLYCEVLEGTWCCEIVHNL